MTKEKKNFIFMWLCVSAIMLGILAIQYDPQFILLIIGVWGGLVVSLFIQVVTIPKKEAVKRISRRIEAMHD